MALRALSHADKNQLNFFLWDVPLVYNQCTFFTTLGVPRVWSQVGNGFGPWLGLPQKKFFKLGWVVVPLDNVWKTREHSQNAGGYSAQKGDLVDFSLHCIDWSWEICRTKMELSIYKNISLKCTCTESNFHWQFWMLRFY